jgi:putative ABC transport system permease protein
VVKASWVQDYILSTGDKKLSAKGQFMDDGAPEMFSFKMLKGNWKGLHSPYSIMLSASVAKALFGDKDPMDQLVMMSNKTSVKVTGVYQDFPVNSQFNYVKFFSPWDLWEAQNDWIKKSAENWDNHFLKIYAEIKPGFTFESVYNNIKDAELLNIKNLENFKDAVARNPKVFLLPMSDWHLHPIDRRAAIDDKPLRMLWLVSIIGAFVLLLACINFMNLSTARSEKRAREVGIRKTIGSRRLQLMVQFFAESFLVVILSFGLSCLLAKLLLPGFNHLSAKEMRLPFNNIYFWLISASTFSSWRLLSKEFVVLVIISLLIAIPIAYYFMHGWLQDYPYRAALSIWIFVLAGAW